MRLNPIETMETSIYNPKHTENTKSLIICSNFYKQIKSMFLKHLSSNLSAFYVDLYGIVNILYIFLGGDMLRATQPN